MTPQQKQLTDKLLKIRLSPHFMMREFRTSTLYPELAERIPLDETDVLKFRLICYTILEPVWEMLNEKYRPKPVKIRILSGKRSYRLNALLGGRKRSLHLQSMAVDFVPLIDYLVSDEVLEQTFQFIKLRLPYAFGELYWQYRRQFIHVSLPLPGKWREAWVAKE